MSLVTDDGHVKAISLILSGQYHIWELYLLDLKSKVFCKKINQIHTQKHGQGTHSAKIGTVVWPKIPKMPLHFSA